MHVLKTLCAGFLDASAILIVEYLVLIFIAVPTLNSCWITIVLYAYINTVTFGDTHCSLSFSHIQGQIKHFHASLC